MEAELQGVTDAMHAAWQCLKMDTRDAQLRRAVRKACNWLKKVRSATVVRFFERHVVELEKQVRVRSNHSASVTRKKTAARQRAYPREGGAVLPLAAERETRHTRFRHPEEAAAASSRECPRDRAHGGGDCHSKEGNGKRESSGAG